MRLDLEGHRPAVADVHHTRVFPNAGKHFRLHLGRGVLFPVVPVHLGRLVGAVLAPHHRVHGQLGVGGPAAEDLAYPLVLVVLEAEFAERLGYLGSSGGMVDGVDLRGQPGRHGDSLVWAVHGGVSTR